MWKQDFFWEVQCTILVGMQSITFPHPWAPGLSLHIWCQSNNNKKKKDCETLKKPSRHKTEDGLETPEVFVELEMFGLQREVWDVQNTLLHSWSYLHRYKSCNKPQKLEASTGSGNSTWSGWGKMMAQGREYCKGGFSVYYSPGIAYLMHLNTSESVINEPSKQGECSLDLSSQHRNLTPNFILIWIVWEMMIQRFLFLG